MSVIEMKHSLITHKISTMRDKKISSKEFRELVREVGMLIFYEVTRDLELYEKDIETPITKCRVKKLKEDDIALVPILRAGLGFVDGIVELVPNAKVGHIGLYRDEETKEIVEYYNKLPLNIDKKLVILLDPMLATGSSLDVAIRNLKAKNVTKIKVLALIAAPEGIEKLTSSHPDVDIYIGTIDEKLNENKYIVPGLGDAGDRLFGTK